MEEETCRFCMQQLPDWRSSLTPVALKPVAPRMAINFEGRTYKLRVRPGPEGLRHFKEQTRNLLGVDVTEQYEVSFECRVPGTQERLKLTGLNTYGAATHCAAIIAAQRQARQPGAAAPDNPRSDWTASQHSRPATLAPALPQPGNDLLSSSGSSGSSGSSSGSGPGEVRGSIAFARTSPPTARAPSGSPCMLPCISPGSAAVAPAVRAPGTASPQPQGPPPQPLLKLPALAAARQPAQNTLGKLLSMWEQLAQKGFTRSSV